METNLRFEKDLVDFQSELFRLALKLTANIDEASDLLQETSLKALINEDKYTVDTNFKGWMYTIMRNIFINNYRKMGDQQYLLQIENVMQADLQHYSSVEMVEKNYDQKEIKHIIASLSPGHRAPFFLYVSGYKYHEIAERLSLPIGTVKSRIYFARQKLQSKLKDYR